MKEIEEPKQHFRGCWMRTEIMEMVFDGTINCKEAMLLTIIDSMVNISGKDCFASNEYLGKRLRSEKRQIQNMILQNQTQKAVEAYMQVIS